MNRRIAKKILNNQVWMQKPNGGCIISLVPTNYGLYYRACKRMHIEPYYTKDQWLKIRSLWKVVKFGYFVPT